jgi:hypothetical protein
MTQRKKDGAERIRLERERQRTVEGYDAKHDDGHDGEDLAWAASCYAAPEEIYVEHRYASGVEFSDPFPTGWGDTRPRNQKNEIICLDTNSKSNREKRIRQLEKAGALIAAEIDRLLRL